LDGDEFGICTSDKVEEDRVFDLAKILNDSFSEPFYTDEHVLYASLSIGIRFNEEGYLSLDDIMNQAEIAMYEVKQTGKSNYALYREEMSESLMRRRELEEELKGALERNELYLVYQPKMMIATGACYGFEALLRWKSEKRGFVSPEIFIDIAEETGLIHSIGQFVIEEACKFSTELNRSRENKYKISVNVSAIQLLREDFMEKFLETIVKYQIQPQELEVEVTESVLMNYMESAVKKLRQLFVLGIDIAIDDFGKGYSSLAYLKTLPVSVVKIDKLFVDDIIENEDLIIEDIIDIGHRMGLKVIAEGVELKEQLDYLKDKNCDSIQGYYYSRPLMKEHLLQFLEQQEAKEVSD
ncbi:MAG: EAL domain-containing protein, partial [Vallitaleaceae bacterium]|nr:EAL domain-containing protein [Vallitaleaceae bacterium]